jgi:hypothetical protein
MQTLGLPTGQAENILALGSQHPEYRKVYAQFSRAANNPRASREVQQLFEGKGKSDLFKAWLFDGRAFAGVTLMLVQTKASTREVSEHGYRTSPTASTVV